MSFFAKEPPIIGLFCKISTNCSALLRNRTYTFKASYESSPLFNTRRVTWLFHACDMTPAHAHTHTYTQTRTRTHTHRLKLSTPWQTLSLPVTHTHTHTRTHRPTSDRQAKRKQTDTCDMTHYLSYSLSNTYIHTQTYNRQTGEEETDWYVQHDTLSLLLSLSHTHIHTDLQPTDRRRGNRGQFVRYCWWPRGSFWSRVSGVW